MTGPLVSPRGIIMHVSGTLVAVLTPFRLSFYLICDPPKNLADFNFIQAPFFISMIFISILRPRFPKNQAYLSIFLSLIFVY